MRFPFSKTLKLILVLTALCVLVAWSPLSAQTPQSQEEIKQEQTEQEGTQEAATEPEEQEAAAATAQFEPVVVTATRVETPLSQMTKSVSVVTTGERDAQEQFFLPELLDNEPGVYMRQLGGIGQWSNVSIRGATSTYIQYQYNGFPLRDAGDPAGTLQYFIEDLYGGSNLKQVEILKGTQSTLYGSQAMGGVINIIPQKWKQGTGFEVRSEFGGHDTFIENGRFYHGQDRFYLDFNPIYVTTDGMKNGGDYGHYYENLGFTTGAGFRFTPDITLEFSAMYSDTDLAMSAVTPSLDADGNVVKNTADPDQHREGLLSQYGLTLNHYVTPWWSYTLKGAYTETERHYFWSETDGDQSNYDGSTGYLEAQHNFRPTDWLNLIVGLDFEKTWYDGREPFNQGAGDFTPVYYKEDWYAWDVFSQVSFKLLDESLFINLGGRLNSHEVFDSKFVGEASVAYLFKPYGTKIHSHVGTGYRTPALYEIYGGYIFNGTLITIGNPDLEAEESVSYEVGVEQTLFDDKVKLGLTWFHTDFDSLISYDYATNRYMNVNKARTEGIETYVNIKPWEWLKLDVAYTHTDSEVEEEDEWVRRSYMPENKVSSMLTLIFPCDLTTSLRVSWHDEQIVPLNDPTWQTVKWEEPDVVTVDAAVTYTFLKKYSAFLRVENMFDKEYTESAYVMPGRSIYGGVKLTF